MKGIIFDIDETLTGALSSYPKSGFKQNPKDVIVLPGVLEGMQFHEKQKYIMVGASNQGRVAAGHKSIEDAIAEMEYTLELIPLLECIYFCPDFEGDYLYKIERNKTEHFSRILDSEDETSKYDFFRKPYPGMLKKASHDYNFDLSQSFMIGDRAEDMEAANYAHCNYLDAEIWRMRFTPGIFELQGVTMAQFELLEGVKYRV